jgi:hypothetical protein
VLVCISRNSSRPNCLNRNCAGVCDGIFFIIFGKKSKFRRRKKAALRKIAAGPPLSNRTLCQTERYIAASSTQGRFLATTMGRLIANLQCAEQSILVTPLYFQPAQQPEHERCQHNFYA